MGNRASVIFHDATSVSPTVYLHWHGDAVPAWLAELKSIMANRFSDAAYAAARFTGICHHHIRGNLSLGLWSNHFTQAELRDSQRMQAESPGDAGLVVVDTRDFTWKAFGGYLINDSSERTSS